MTNKRNKKKENADYYFREENNKIADDIESLNLLAIQVEGIKLGMIAFILIYIASIQGMELIASKYTNNDDDESPENLAGSSNPSIGPDFISLQATYIFFIERMIFTFIALRRYDIVYNKSILGEFRYSLEPNIFINTANLLGLLSDLYFILGAEGIYARDNIQPIFGV